MPDRFSADEARRIFARAARRQHAAPTPDGLSLADLEQIGAEAGLDPALVAAEAAAERLGAEAQRTWHGVPSGIRRSRLLPARISDAEWERVVDLLRGEFKLAGVSEQIGRRREWASVAGTGTGSQGSSAYRVRVEPRPDGDLVTVEAPNVGEQIGRLLGVPLVITAPILAVLVGGIERDVVMGGVIGAAVLAAALLCYLVAWLSVRAAAPKATARVDALLDRIDLVSRADRPAAPAGRLDPAPLDAEPEAVDSTPPRRRARA